MIKKKTVKKYIGVYYNENISISFITILINANSQESASYKFKKYLTEEDVYININRIRIRPLNKLDIIH